MENLDIIEIYLNSKNANSFPSEYTSDAVFHIPNIEIAKNEKAYRTISKLIYGIMI